MNSDQHFFDIDFPTKLIHKKGLLRNGWITKRIKIPSQKKNEIFKYVSETTKPLGGRINVHC